MNLHELLGRSAGVAAARLAASALSRFGGDSAALLHFDARDDQTTAVRLHGARRWIRHAGRSGADIAAVMRAVFRRRGFRGDMVPSGLLSESQ